MKTNRYRYILIAAASLMLVACFKEMVDRSVRYPVLEPLQADANAGLWKPILLAYAGDIAVAAPAAPTGPDYVAQINEIRSFQANLTAAGKKDIEYWGAGAVLRWNEITRELVAKYNLPPKELPDGTYPFPDPNNPLAYPAFPFANPPYAARAYAYISAAVYDALVACYHYKQQYNRAAPYKVNNTIKPMLPVSDLPSYPSEDATVAGVMWEMIRLLFPGEQALATQRVESHLNSRIAAGMNVRTDIEAGYALGRAVAQRFVARARTDRAGAAIGTPAQWAALERQTEARGEVPWISQETPRRPPMLPLFGAVRTWLFDSATLIAIRPPAPPSTSSKQFRDDVEEVYRYARNPTRREIGIAQHWSDGVGTYTPPGHWNAIASDIFVKQRISEVRWARNMALLNMALADAAIGCWEAKYYYFNPRPSQMDKRIKTTVGLPNFPSYTSGHSTFSGAAATILGHLAKDEANRLNEMAHEASMSRMYGAIHYRVDCEEGLKHGQRIGNYAIQRAKSDGAE